MAMYKPLWQTICFMRAEWVNAQIYFFNILGTRFAIRRNHFRFCQSL